MSRRRAALIVLTIASLVTTGVNLAAGDSLQLTQSLSNVALPLGSNLTLSCRFNQQPSYIIWKFTAPLSAPRTLLRCQPALGSCGAIDSVPGFDDIGEYADANGSLTLTGLTPSHNGIYQCRALLRIQAASSQADVTVLAAPSKPTIKVSGADTGAEVGTVTARRGASLSLTCSAAGANPAPDVVWTLERPADSAGARRLTGSEDFANITLTPSATPFGVTISQLTLTALTAADDATRVRCTAVHQLENRTSDDFRLVVLYEPSVTPMRPLSLELGSESIVECSARGNPTPLVHLADSTGKVLSAATLGTSRHRLRALRSNQSGLYFCAATNSMGAANASFAVDVQFGPVVGTPSQLTVRAGAGFQADCTAVGNPTPTKAEWRHVTSEGRRLIGRQLRLDVVSRSDAGLWRCQFENELTAELLAGEAGEGRLRLGWADLQLVVEYPPEQPQVAASRLVNGQLDLLAGDSATVECLANELSPGIPAPSLSWSRNRRQVSASARLLLSNASLHDSGRYLCTPANSLGSGRPVEISVNVEQPPRWLQPASAIRRTVTAAVNASDFRLDCPAAVALPEASVRWLKDGQPLRLSGSDASFSVESLSDPAEVTGIITRSYLHFRGTKRHRLQPEDNGRYECELSNSHGKLVGDLLLLVEFPPLIESGQRKAAAPAAGTAGISLSCSASGQPPPSLSWQFNGAAIADAASTLIATSATAGAGDTATNYRRSSRLDGVTALGTYTCLATNLLGTDHRDIQVVPPGLPDPPESLTVADVGWDFVYVVWRRGFDGGSPARHWLTATAAASTGGLGNLSWPADPTSQEAANATRLMPGVNYTFRVYAESWLGRSVLSQPVWRVTPALSLPKPSRVQLTKSGSLLVSALDNFCLRVESSEDTGSNWSVYQFCVPSGSVELVSMDRRLLYRASLCLTDRPEVCGLPTLANGVAASSMASLPEIPTSAIIIVGAGCAALILVLCSVLAYFCCKKPAQYKEMDVRRQCASAHHRAGSNATTAAAAVPQYQTSDGKPYALVPPHPPSSTTSASVAGPEGKPLDSRRSSIQKDELVVMETSADRRSTVFATLRSAHNPLDSSNSNPAMFSYAPEDYADDNRNTDPYGLESHYQSRPKRIVYEVVV